MLQSFRRYWHGRRWRPLVGLALIGVIEMALVIRARLGEDYAAAVSSPSMLSLTVNTRAVVIPAGFLIPALALLLVTRSWRGALIAGLWIAPQIVIHGIAMQERYLYPAILMSAGVTALALGMIKRGRWVLVVALVVALVIGALASWRNPVEDARVYAEEGRAFQVQMSALATAQPPSINLNSELVEWNVSAETWLRYYGYEGEIEISGARP